MVEARLFLWHWWFIRWFWNLQNTTNGDAFAQSWCTFQTRKFSILEESRCNSPPPSILKLQFVIMGQKMHARQRSSTQQRCVFFFLFPVRQVTRLASLPAFSSILGNNYPVHWGRNALSHMRLGAIALWLVTHRIILTPNNSSFPPRIALSLGKHPFMHVLRSCGYSASLNFAEPRCFNGIKFVDSSSRRCTYFEKTNTGHTCNFEYRII